MNAITCTLTRIWRGTRLIFLASFANSAILTVYEAALVQLFSPCSSGVTLMMFLFVLFSFGLTCFPTSIVSQQPSAQTPRVSPVSPLMHKLLVLFVCSLHAALHASHMSVCLRCLLKWLEIRSVCPMCNKPICRLQPDAPPAPEQPQSLLEV